MDLQGPDARSDVDDAPQALLPEHPLESELLRPIRSGKRILVRFDLNDYSIPPDAVGKALTLAATAEQVRLLDGTVEIARHRRSYDRHELVMDPAHQQALLAEKRKALGASRSSRLLAAAPEAETLLQQAVLRHEPAAGQTGELLREHLPQVSESQLQRQISDGS